MRHLKQTLGDKVMTIWIDGDACPKVIKEIICRAAVRARINTYFISNHWVALPPSPFIKRYLVQQGFDKADSYIIEQLQPEDLVITADIPLAHAIIQAQASALSPRGELFTKENIKQILALRNFHEELRSCQLLSGGHTSLSTKEMHLFASHLDKWIAKNNIKN